MENKIVITDCDHGHIAPEQQACNTASVSLAFLQSMDPEQVIAGAQNATALLTQRFQVTEKVMAAIPSLKVIGRYGSGVDNVDLAAAKKKGIKVVYTPYFCFTDVANHTVANLLFLSRGMHSMDKAMKQDTSSLRARYSERIELAPFVRRPTSTTVGIVGFGKIGRAVASRLRGFGFKIVAFDPYVPSQVMEEFGAFKLAGLEDLALKSDFLTVHTPLTSETKGMISAQILAKMKPSAYVINNARGGIVNEGALFTALVEKKIAGAALDVLEVEPIQESLPFRALPNVLLSPHMAFYSQESLADLKERIIRYTINSLRGEGEWEEIN